MRKIGIGPNKKEEVEIDEANKRAKLHRWDKEEAIEVVDKDCNKVEISKKEDKYLKFNSILEEKPGKNKFRYRIKGAGRFNFFYQPPLTEEEKEQGCHRPESVVGSYAVYHKRKKDNKYKTGKAFHIYRPKIIDDKGKETYGKLDFAKGILTVEIPQEFLDNATYPITIDPTFGYTSVASSDTYMWSQIEALRKISPNENGQVYSITAYTRGWDAGDKVKCAIYEGDGTTLLNVTEVKTSGGDGWHTFNLQSNVTVNASKEYTLAIWSDGAFDYVAREDVDGYYRGYDDKSYGDYNGEFPNSLNYDYTYSDEVDSIYANYTETSTGTTVNVSKQSTSSSQYSPSISQALSKSVSVQTLTSSLYGPSLEVIKSVSSQAISDNLRSPRISQALSISPGIQNLSSSLYGPNISQSLSIQASIQSLSSNLYSPSVTTTIQEVIVNAGIQGLSSSISSPSIVNGLIVNAETIRINASLKEIQIITPVEVSKLKVLAHSLDIKFVGDMSKWHAAGASELKEKNAKKYGLNKLRAKRKDPLKWLNLS